MLMCLLVGVNYFNYQLLISIIAYHEVSFAFYIF